MRKSTLKFLVKNSLNIKYYKALAEILYKKWASQRISFIYSKREWEVKTDDGLKPIWVLGMFRSGTSVTCQILSKLNLDFGPNEHLLQAVGRLRDLNPNGFYENYVLAEYSRYFFKTLGGRGDKIPTIHSLNKVSFSDVNIDQLFRWSLFDFNDDRITLRHKYESFKYVAKFGLNEYLRSQFKGRPTIKIPMLSHFYPQIKAIWPDSLFLIVFRHPDGVLKSSRTLTEGNDCDLYNDYYRFLLEIHNTTDNFLFFSYDHLISDPDFSIECLKDKIGLNQANEEEISSIIDKKLIRNRPTRKIDNIETEKIYNQMLDLSINVK